MMTALPSPVFQIIDRLERQGYQAYAAGGCVRDILREAYPHDWDVCTSAPPWEIVRCFASERVIETGIQHGTVTVLIDSIPVEVTAFRSDGPYSDGRHPDYVRFGTDLPEDLSRRDFTINAMAMDRKEKIIDLFGGRADLEAGCIRCVGDPGKRFGEDALRIMRALRLAAVLGFSIDPKTAESIHRNKERLQRIAPERISAELLRMLSGGSVFPVLSDFGDVLGVIIPEIFPAAGTNKPTESAFLHEIFKTVAALEPIPVLRLAALLGSLEKGDGTAIADETEQNADRILRRLRLDKHTITQACTLIRFQRVEFSPDISCVRTWVGRLGHDTLRQLLCLRKAEWQIKGADCRDLDEVSRLQDEIIREKLCCTRAALAVNGKDLLRAGFLPGKEMGRILDTLLQKVICGNFPNEREALLCAAKNLCGEGKTESGQPENNF